MKAKKIMCKCLCIVLCMLSAISIAENAVPSYQNAQTKKASQAIQGPIVMQNQTLYFPPSSSAPDIQKDATWQAIPARLNQRMATRSGPSSLYTEELGTLPMSTAITVLWQEKTGVAWAMVEYEKNGKLYRAYTGMKRIDTEEDIPILESTSMYRSSLLLTIRPSYGPGRQYQSLDYTLGEGLSVLVYTVDQGYALIEYHHPYTDQPARAWVPVSALRSF